jgi:acyl dehydratase
MSLARQSSEVPVQDQDQGRALVVADPPWLAVVVDEFDVGKPGAQFGSRWLVLGSQHDGSEPTLPVMTSHDRPFGRHLEDFEVGDIYKHWPGKTITEADDHLFCMITMNHHPLHTNQWFAENETVHGKNVVVGNLVYSLVLGMSVADVSGAAIANLEIETLKHSKPTFHGDTIYAETRVLGKRESSKGDRGIVEVETKGINQRGEEVCYFKRKVLVWKRDAAPPRQRPYDESIWDED